MIKAIWCEAQVMLIKSVNGKEEACAIRKMLKHNNTRKTTVK